MSMTEQIESALNKISVIFRSDRSELADLRRLSGGASQETWAFTVTDGETGSHRYILRRAPDGQSDGRSDAAIALSTEAKLIEEARKRGVPAPNVLHICTPEDGLGDGFIMAFLEGETIARKILRDEAYSAARPGLASACGEALAKIHALPTGDLVDLGLPQSDGLAQLTQYEEIYSGFERPRPILELAFQVLRKRPPRPLAPVLVHGDFRLGNLMIDQRGLAGVLDWELAHIGDPREDIGWICVNSWRFGQSEKRVGGFGSVETLLAAYSQAGGGDFSPEEIDWWEMLG